MFFKTDNLPEIHKYLNAHAHNSCSHLYTECENNKIATATKLHQYGSDLLLVDNLGNMENYKMKNIIYIMSKK